MEEKPQIFDSEPSERNDLESILEKISKIQGECHKILVGQEKLIELLLVSMLSDGHVLLEGVPGIAKTLSAKVIAKALDVDFSRIQFTPDLMPSDIIGTSIYNNKDSTFDFKKGPIFSNIVLIDEINRAPAKTQSALFEVMEEKQITFDGDAHMMDYPFIVIATQNPVEQEGTYRLPEGQLDRFMMKIVLDYPNHENELKILKRFRSQIRKPDLDVVESVLTIADLRSIQGALEEIHIEDQMIEYILHVVQATRQHAHLYLGASPRAALAILRASKATALLAGRTFVIPDDIKFVTPYVLNHRLILTPIAEMESMSVFDIIHEILRAIEIPR